MKTTASPQRSVTDRWVQDIGFAPSSPDIVYVATAGLILYRSDDGGRTFSKVANLRQFIDSQP